MPRSSALSPQTLTEAGAGIWSLDGDRLSMIESFDIGPAIILVPTEHVLLMTADLPLPSHRRRIEALPFAIEDRVAEPFGAVHAALGAEVAPGRYLAAVVAHRLMAQWTAAIDATGLGHARLVPDALALPVPAAGGWSVDLAGGRAMVRTDDGAGFALPAANLDAAWRLAGEPAVRAYGEKLPFALAEESAELEVAPLAASLTAPALDLRQGAFAPPRAAASPLLRRIALVAAFGVVAHGAIAAADVLALDIIASQRASQTRKLAEQAAPGIVLGDDVASAVADLLPANGSGPSAFLPLVARISTALAPLGPAATLANLSYDDGAGTVAIDVEAADVAGLQRVGQALTAGGLSVQPGATAIAPGKASGAFLIRGAR